jgi:hypothetical protein
VSRRVREIALAVAAAMGAVVARPGKHRKRSAAPAKLRAKKKARRKAQKAGRRAAKR